jgi:branched-chain amino acid transport system ATP-binding protein
MVIMVITGGKGSLAGPVVGGMIFGLLPVFLRPIMAPEAQWIAYGGVLIVILFVLPRGIVPSLAQRFAKPRNGIETVAPVAFSNVTPRSMRDDSSSDCVEGGKGRRAFRGARCALGHELCGRRGRDRQPDRPNGAGKTTAFNIVTGFLDPTHGAVSYRGTALNGLKPHQIADLGLIRTFQRTSVFPNDTVYDNLLVGLHRQGRVSLLEAILGLPRARSSQRRLRERASELVEWVGLERRAHDLAGSLSYGEQRLVGVALALAAEPSMLLLDEPVSGMNASETHTFVQLVRNIRDRGVTILLVEHDMPMVMSVSDRIVVLNYGRIIAEGSPDVIRNDPAVIEAYLGQGSDTCLRSETWCVAMAASPRCAAFRWQVKAGQLVALIGANGAGKSTTLRAISGLVAPRSGSMLFEGKDIAGAKPPRVVASGSRIVRKDGGYFRT